MVVLEHPTAGNVKLATASLTFTTNVNVLGEQPVIEFVLVREAV
jgi:hypothetical protein